MTPSHSPHDPESAHLGWYDRGRLPHFDAPYQIQAVTFRLIGSLPKQLLDSWERELESLDQRSADRERRRRIEQWLDAGQGDCFLKDPRIAALVRDALIHFDGIRYQLRAWCVMPNHVHVLFDEWPGHPLPQVVLAWKCWTALRANKLLGRSGPFWQRDYFDRYIRNSCHLARAIEYIENNPVKAGLVATAAEWPWSSARNKKPHPDQCDPDIVA